MLRILQIAFPVLVVACAASASFFLAKSNIANIETYLSSSLLIIGFLFYLYTGLRISDSASLSLIRRVLIKYVIGSTRGLLISSTVLIGFLALFISLGMTTQQVDFVLRDLWVGDLYGKPVEDLNYPQNISDLSIKNISFTLASSSSRPVWIQNIYITVKDIQPLRQSTFPYYGEGAPGPKPIHGYVVLKPKPGRYKVITTTKAKLGQGIDPDEYRLDVFAESGYIYTVGVEIEWFDMDNAVRGGKFVFTETERVEMPKLVQWEELFLEAKSVKILFYHFVEQLVNDINYLGNVPKYRVLIAPGHDSGFEYFISKRDFNNVMWIPKGAEKHITDLVGRLPGWYDSRPRNFLLFDSRLLILQDTEVLHRAEIIDDKKLIDSIEREYDALVNSLTQ